MKKIVLFILSLFLITGCSKDIKMELHTEIKENSNELISINYPVFNINKLNKLIKKDINQIMDTFQSIKFEEDSSEKELNIDYTYNLVNDNIINVTIISYIYSSNSDTNEYIYTYVFDKSQNKLLNVSDVVKNTSPIKNTMTDKFVINNEFINFYSISNNKVVLNKLPLSDLELNLIINNKEVMEEKYNYIPVNKVIDPSKPVIALTFDDGPSKYTSDIIDLLREYDCNATFFVLGNKVSYYRNTIQKSISYGNEIGNHTYNHKWLSRLSVDAIKEQIEKTQNIIYENTNYKSTLLRPTYGAINKKIRSNTDLQIVLWNIDTMDWRIKDSKKIASRAISTIKDGSIILMHDTYERTYKALKIMIPELKNQGFQFVTVSELKEIQTIREKSI